MTTQINLKNLRVIDAGEGERPAVPLIGSGYANYVDHPVTGRAEFHSYEFIVSLGDDAVPQDWLVSIAASDSHMLICEATAWLLTAALGLPVPDAAFMILNQAQIKLAVPSVDIGDEPAWLGFARRDYDFAPRRLSFSDVLLLLATHQNRADALFAAAPFIRHWADALFAAAPFIRHWAEVLLPQPAAIDAFMARLARVAGVDPAALKKPGVATQPAPAKAKPKRRRKHQAATPATV